MRKIQRRESELIKSVSVALRFIRSSRGLGHLKMRRVYTGALLANLRKNERKDFIYEKFRKRTEAWKKWNRKSVH